MKILIIGGTRFLGRYLVEVALRRGHEITLFHRGKTNLGLYPQVETILGDRVGGLDALAGRT
ncbi:MAG: NAD-dependent epimerase/dehydratase family protein, partial [Anaerolineales bacterium]